LLLPITGSGGAGVVTEQKKKIVISIVN
jgi:hypothetical protein